MLILIANKNDFFSREETKKKKKKLFEIGDRVLDGVRLGQDKIMW